MNSDPPRLLDDPSASPSLRADLARAADARLEGLDLDAGLERLRTATRTGSSGPSGTSLATKLAVGATLAAAAAALWIGSRDPTPAPQVATAPAVSAGPSEAPSEALEPIVGEPLRSVRTSSELDPAEAIGSTPVDGGEVDPTSPASAEPEDASALEDGSEPAHAAGAANRAELADGSEPADSSGSAPDDPAPRARSHGRAPATQPAEPSVDDVLREARMVAQARASLAKDPSRALELTEQAEEEFPQGQLVEERRALAIRALAALGRHEQARRRADEFLARFGRGAHAEAVRRAVAPEAPAGEAPAP